MSDKLVTIVILKGTNNYIQWKHNLQATLQSKKLWNLIVGAWAM
jgi:hypothetical protein